MRILLAEDNEINQQLGVRLLERHGHHVTLARDGEEALARFLAAPGAFDLILMDVQMPVRNGPDAAREVRRHEREHGGRIPILALTAHADPARMQGCLDAGMDGVVSKPLDLTELEAAMAEVTGAATDPASPPAPRPPAVGWDAALDLVLGDEAVLLEMAGLFLGRAEGLVDAVVDAHVGGDAHALERAAHRLKGAIGNFAAAEAVEIADRIERAAEDGDLAATGALLPDLRRAVEAVCAELRRRVEEAGP